MLDETVGSPDECRTLTLSQSSFCDRRRPAALVQTSCPLTDVIGAPRGARGSVRSHVREDLTEPCHFLTVLGSGWQRPASFWGGDLHSSSSSKYWVSCSWEARPEPGEPRCWQSSISGLGWAPWTVLALLCSPQGRGTIVSSLRK